MRLKKKINSSNKANLIKVWWKCFSWDGYPCMDLLLWTVFGQHCVGNLSSSFPHSTPASTGNKDQGQPTSQQDLKEISGTLQDYIIMPAQSFSWIHVKFSSWLGASRLFLPKPEQPPVCLQELPCTARLPGFLRIAQPLPELRRREKRSPCSSWGACSCSPHTRSRHWPPTPPEGGLGPPAEQVPTN